MVKEPRGGEIPSVPFWAAAGRACFHISCSSWPEEAAGAAGFQRLQRATLHIDLCGSISSVLSTADIADGCFFKRPPGGNRMGTLAIDLRWQWCLARGQGSSFPAPFPSQPLLSFLWLHTLPSPTIPLLTSFTFLFHPSNFSIFFSLRRGNHSPLDVWEQL